LKKILILHPHFPPSNLASVHRPRLFAQHLPSFDWEPTILTVHEKFYEEKLDWNLHALVSKKLNVVKVNAFSVGKFRLIGDIGLRAFFQLYKKAKQIIREDKIDFLYIPIPSFYCALLGRWLHETTKIKYGIDYIDPWVHFFPGSEKMFSRHWFSTKIAKLLEPIAVKKASLITGVASGYYQPVLDRNNCLQQVIAGAMPYGAEPMDAVAVASANLEPFLFSKTSSKIRLVYAGAMLPKAYQPLEYIFSALSSNKPLYENIEFHFIGTGKTANDANGFNIKALAEKYKLWENIVFEYPARISYIDVLVHLQFANGIFVLGSTEPHYTPSKIFQAVLSKKPIFALLHEASTAAPVVISANAGVVGLFNEDNVHSIEVNFKSWFQSYLEFVNKFEVSNINVAEFEMYTAKSITKELVQLLNKCTA
jgi:hypothetical protein